MTCPRSQTSKWQSLTGTQEVVEPPVFIPPAAQHHSSVRAHAFVKILCKGIAIQCEHSEEVKFLEEQLANVPKRVPSPPLPIIVVIGKESADKLENQARLAKLCCGQGQGPWKLLPLTQEAPCSPCAPSSLSSPL